MCFLGLFGAEGSSLVLDWIWMLVVLFVKMLKRVWSRINYFKRYTYLSKQLNIGRNDDKVMSCRDLLLLIDLIYYIRNSFKNKFMKVTSKTVFLEQQQEKSCAVGKNPSRRLYNYEPAAYKWSSESGWKWCFTKEGVSFAPHFMLPKMNLPLCDMLSLWNKFITRLCCCSLKVILLLPADVTGRPKFYKKNSLWP